MNKIEGKYYMIGGAAMLIIAVVFFAVLNAGNTNAVNTGSKSVTTNNLGSGNNLNSGVQGATLSMKDWKYVVEPSTLKKGVPVRMTVDLKTVVGCATDVVIKDFGVRKAVRAGDNIIEFTPTKTGTILIACSMNMFHGSFEVVDDANPDAPAEIQATIPQSTGGSCGASGGGCGCGARNV